MKKQGSVENSQKPTALLHEMLRRLMSFQGNNRRFKHYVTDTTTSQSPRRTIQVLTWPAAKWQISMQ